MADREGNSHGAAITKKSKSLDLKSLYKSKVTKEAPKKDLKRKISLSGGDEKKNKKKKTKKEVCVTSLENVNGSIKKIDDEECHKGPCSVRQDLCESKLEVKQSLSSSGGLNSVLLSLNDGVVHIPKRKRDFVGRKKCEVGQVPTPAGQPSCKSGHGDQIPKLSSDDFDKGIESSKIRQKKKFDKFKESRSSDSNPVQHFKDNEDHASHSVVNSGGSALKRSQRKDRKQKALAPDRFRVAKEAEPLIDGRKVVREDDEENLEENAARMLSSRFDPNFAGFPSSSKPSTLPSANGLSSSLSSNRNIIRRGSKSRLGSESASVDAAGRVLRPRKQYKEKGSSRKRRHFYEILLGDLDPYWILNQRIKVFWPLDQSWYFGLVNDYDKEKKAHHIKYDDREEEWIDLQTERFKLLLLPSQVPGKTEGKRAVTKSRNSDQPKGSKSRKEKRQIREVITEDDSCGESCMDTQPIIAWLARSSHRVKPSPFHGIKKHKTTVTLPNTASSLLYDEPLKVQGCLTKSSMREVKSNLSSDSVSQDKLGDRFGRKSSLQNANCLKVDKPPIVYFRRRFRRLTPISPHISEANCVNISASCSISFEPVVGGAMDVREPNDRRVETEGPLWFTYNAGASNFFLDWGSAALKFNLSYPISLVLSGSFRSEKFWWLHAVLMLQYGTVKTMWPRVHLEMLFVDNVVGLRFLLFEGCLKMAVAFVFWVLKVFHQPADQGKYNNLQFPVTSIRFSFSSVHVRKKPIVFEYYNFSRVKNSKWTHLDLKLKRHCLLSKQLHLSECTYDNIQALQNGSSEYPLTSTSGEPSIAKVMRKRTRPGIKILGVSKELTQVDTSKSSDGGKRKIPPFSLSFAAVPTFFLSLHLKLLMEQSGAHVSFCGHARVDDQEDSGLMTDDCSSVDDSSINDSSNRNIEFVLKKNMVTLSKDAVYVGLPCAESDLLIGSSNCNDQILSQNNNSTGLSSDRTSGSHGFKRPGNIQLPEWQTHSYGLRSLPSSSLTDKVKADDGSHSFPDSVSLQIPSVDQVENPADGDMHDAQHSSDFSWNINGGVIPRHNPTAPRSSWHRNRNSSSSLGFQSHGWSDGKADSLHNGFSNRPKKPRTQVSYSVPFSRYDFNSRHRSHHQKGLPLKRIRKANEKKALDIVGGPEKNLESLSCDVNVLITLGDKGWRESGAQVVLELFDRNEWKLSVKIAGITRYSYKAHQFLQMGSTNRYTHAMMWKGGKDWILEFPDRSQWALFKEMHEECYNRNIRAASVKNIPIPGVLLIEENDGNEPEVAFVRSSKYFRQVETDVEMALNPLLVLYDMDSEDEQWILTIQNSEKGNSDLDGISEMFEKTMDMFEKAAYAQQRDQFTPTEIEELMVDVGPSSAAKIIYEQWQQKRQKKGMALIRHFQPPLWEIYQQQLREWEVAMTKNNLSVSNGCLGKVATLEKPPMFAFCLKPRGLELLNKGSKHRSQKRISVSGHTSGILYEQDGVHTFGRRLNGFAFSDEKFVFPGHNYDSLDDSPLPQTSPRVFSPRDAGSMGYYFMGNNGNDRSHFPIYQRSKSRKFGSFMYHNDSQMTGYSPRASGSGMRNGVSRWNMGYSPRASGSGMRNGVSRWNMGYDLAGHRLDGPQRHAIEQMDGSDLDEFRLRDASGAAQHARNMAKLKRERAKRLLYRADLAIHKAVAALMTAEAMKASSEDSNDDG